jgi:hypothetical protein
MVTLCITSALQAYPQPSWHRKVHGFLAMSVRSSTPDFGGSPYSPVNMERLLFLWDELDDWAGAGRHLAISTAAEVALLAGPLLSASSALALWFLVPQSHMNAALLGLTATFWGGYRKLLHPHR